MHPLIFLALLGLVSSVMTMLGTILLGNPAPSLPPPVDSLHGKSTLAEMNAYTEQLLAAGKVALVHDQRLLDRYTIIVVISFILSIVCAAVYIQYLRRSRHGIKVPLLVKLFFWSVVVIPPLTACGMKLSKGHIFQTSVILADLSNPNTEPGIVLPGQTVTFEVPTTLQSLYGNYEGKSVSIDRCDAQLIDDSVIHLECTNPKFTSSHHEDSHFYVEMRYITPQVEITLPMNNQLYGALITSSISGRAEIQVDQQERSTSPFEGSTTFRLSNANEGQFYLDCERMSGWLTKYLVISLITSAGIILGVRPLSMR
jgi:hypothetical protein